MATDQSFAVATHSLVMLAFKHPERVSASAIADEMSLHPVVIRRTMSRLAHAGLVTSTPGAHGGYSLIDVDVDLRTILEAVHGRSALLGRFFEVPQSSCEEGRAVDALVADIHAEADRAALSVLKSWSIAKVRDAALAR